MNLTQKRLKSILEYNPQTGIFIWKESSMASIQHKVFNMIPTTILATLMLASPVDCLEYLGIRVATRPAMATEGRITPSLVVITASGAKVALQCRGKEYRAVLLAL